MNDRLNRRAFLRSSMLASTALAAAAKAAESPAEGAAAAPKEVLVDFDGDGLVDVAAGAYTRVDVAYGSGRNSWIEWSSIS